jgi:hypothetical protein
LHCPESDVLAAYHERSLLPEEISHHADLPRRALAMACSRRSSCRGPAGLGCLARKSAVAMENSRTSQTRKARAPFPIRTAATVHPAGASVSTVGSGANGSRG